MLLLRSKSAKVPLSNKMISNSNGSLLRVFRPLFLVRWTAQLLPCLLETKRSAYKKLATTLFRRKQCAGSFFWHQRATTRFQEAVCWECPWICKNCAALRRQEKLNVCKHSPTSVLGARKVRLSPTPRPRTTASRRRKKTTSRTCSGTSRRRLSRRRVR